MGEGGGENFFTEWEESFDSFDDMGLHENLLRGIYAYGKAASDRLNHSISTKKCMICADVHFSTANLASSQVLRSLPPSNKKASCPLPSP